MVNYQEQTHDEQMNLIFHSMADPTRRKILERLMNQNLTVTEIAKPHDISLPAISKHLKILEEARLIGREKNGREYMIHIIPQTLQTAAEYIEFYTKFWNKHIDNLEKFLKKGVDNNRRK